MEGLGGLANEPKFHLANDKESQVMSKVTQKEKGKCRREMLELIQ